jgi:plastocyanin domain-containing protein
MDGTTQVIKMNAAGGYQPNHFIVRAGVPVRWEVSATAAGGCANVLVSRQLKLQKFLNPGVNIIEFTTAQAGEIQFSCSMGMYRGSFTVTPNQS